METTEQQERKITHVDIQACIKKHGSRKVSKMMSAFGKNLKVYEALKTEIGQVFFKDAMDRIASLLGKITEGDSSTEERLEYKITRDMLISWGSKLVSLEKLRTEITGQEKNDA